MPPISIPTDDGWVPPRIRLPRTRVQLDARVQIHIRQQIVTTIEATIHTTKRVILEAVNTVTIWEKYIYVIEHEANAVVDAYIRPSLSKANKRIDDLEKEVRRLKFIVADALQELVRKKT